MPRSALHHCRVVAERHAPSTQSNRLPRVENAVRPRKRGVDAITFRVTRYALVVTGIFAPSRGRGGSIETCLTAIAAQAKPSISPGPRSSSPVGHQTADPTSSHRSSNGGQGRNRTGVRGFAGRCMTTLPPGHCSLRRRSKGSPLAGKNKTSVVRGFKNWSGKRDSNSRPRPWQGRALPTELFPH